MRSNCCHPSGYRRRTGVAPVSVSKNGSSFEWGGVRYANSHSKLEMRGQSQARRRSYGMNSVKCPNFSVHCFEATPQPDWCAAGREFIPRRILRIVPAGEGQPGRRRNMPATRHRKISCALSISSVRHDHRQKQGWLPDYGGRRRGRASSRTNRFPGGGLTISENFR